MRNKNLSTILACLLLLAPLRVAAIFMPTSGNDLAEMTGISAQAYIVSDAQSGNILISKNAQLPWTPASLTKLVTAMVVLDTKPKLSKIVTMTTQDQVAGECSSGGSCIKSKAGIKFTLDGLFHALLLPSANNAANALARSTGLTPSEFALKMNRKAASLGATASIFNEPTGLDPANKITAGDYALILTAAFNNQYLRGIAALNNYALHSANNSRYNQVINNTNRLIGDGDVQILGAKTGYLNESEYNFAALLKYRQGPELAVVVLGEQHMYSAFAETKQLAAMASVAQALAMFSPSPSVLGTSTVSNLNN